MDKAPTELKKKYDMVVIGSGPGGQRAAIQAAKVKKSVLIVEKDDLGGSCLHTGTIPSKTLREAASLSHSAELSALSRVMAQKNLIISEEKEVIDRQMQRNGVDYVQGIASFLTPNKLAVKTAVKLLDIEADYVVLATGSRPICPANIPFNHTHVFNSDSILNLDKLPETMAVMGAGVIGCEYASIFAKLGVKVTLLDRRNCLLRAVDQEIVGLLAKHFNENHIAVLQGCEIGTVSLVDDKNKTEVAVEIKGEKHFFSSQPIYI